MGLIFAHCRVVFPTARAFRAVCMREYDSRTRHIRKTKGALRRWASDNRCARGDGDFREALIIEETRIGFVLGVGREAKEPEAARALLRFFTAPAAAEVLKANGVEPFVE